MNFRWIQSQTEDLISSDTHTVGQLASWLWPRETNGKDWNFISVLPSGQTSQTLSQKTQTLYCFQYAALCPKQSNKNSVHLFFGGTANCKNFGALDVHGTPAYEYWLRRQISNDFLSFYQTHLLHQRMRAHCEGRPPSARRWPTGCKVLITGSTVPSKAPPLPHRRPPPSPTESPKASPRLSLVLLCWLMY